MRKNKLVHGLFTSLALVILTLSFAGRVEAKAVEGVVNINTASEKELTMLPGIGKAKAIEIMQLRQTKPFASVDDLKSIKGLGAKRLEALRPHVTVSGPTTAKAIKTPKAAPASPQASTPATPQSRPQS